jgi:hypothetical protein
VALVLWDPACRENAPGVLRQAEAVLLNRVATIARFLGPWAYPKPIKPPLPFARRGGGLTPAGTHRAAFNCRDLQVRSHDTIPQRYKLGASFGSRSGNGRGAFEQPRLILPITIVADAKDARSRRIDSAERSANRTWRLVKIFEARFLSWTPDLGPLAKV